MAKTQLNMKLFYKGKLLNFATSGKEIKKKFFIGSDRFEFWQILDKSFPHRYELVTKKNDGYYLNISPKMQFAYDGDNAQKISGKNVLLTNDKTGKLNIGADWIISYEYSEPRAVILTEEERLIVAQYSRRAELDPREKFTRNFLIAATALTIIGIILFETFKPEEKVINTLEDYAQHMEELAQKVKTDSDSRAFEEETGGEEEQKEQPVVAPKAQPGGGGQATMSKEQAKAALAGLMGGSGFSSGSSGSVKAVTYEENIVASSLGGGRGGGGSGKGPGKRGSGGGDGGGDAGSVFDPSDVSSGIANLAGLSSGKMQGKLTSQAPAGGATAIVGDLGKMVPLGKAANKVSAATLNRFTAPTVKKVSEGNIAAAPEELRPDYQKVESRVARYKPQIKDQFNRYSQIKAMYGTIRFTLFIEADGSVADVQVTPLSGEFYPEFISQLTQMIRNWRFDSKTMIPYEFTMTFGK